MYMDWIDSRRRWEGGSVVLLWLWERAWVLLSSTLLPPKPCCCRDSRADPILLFFSFLPLQQTSSSIPYHFHHPTHSSSPSLDLTLPCAGSSSSPSHPSLPSTLLFLHWHHFFCYYCFGMNETMLWIPWMALWLHRVRS